MEKKAIKKIFREFVGVVKSTAMNKTITVQVNNIKKHSKYPKSFTVSRKYHVHDEKQSAKVGDTVRFVECRPLSATKRWRLIEILKVNG
jgi:small subunit ribosomal protein S17